MCSFNAFSKHSTLLKYAIYIKQKCINTIVGPMVSCLFIDYLAAILIVCKRNNNVSSPSTCESQYCGEPPWPRGSVLGLRRQGSYFESWVWRTVSFQSSHHPQEVLLAQFSLYVHKGGLKPDSFHFNTSM